MRRLITSVAQHSFYFQGFFRYNCIDTITHLKWLGRL